MSKPAKRRKKTPAEEFKLVKKRTQFDSSEEVMRFLPDILGRALARSWIDREFQTDFMLDPEGVTFAAYAAIRVRGSIIDCLRRNSNLCRTTISMQQKVRAAERDLEMEHQRAPTPEELSEKMEMTLEELQNWQARFQASRVKSLDEVYTDHSLLFQDVTPSPEEATHQSQLRTMLRKAISKLPEREALVLQLYYLEELNVYEVAAILDVTTGRVSQIKRAATERAHSLIMEQMD